jgi:hypothetical protein
MHATINRPPTGTFSLDFLVDFDNSRPHGGGHHPVTLELYQKHGIRFQYPDDWQLAEEAAPDGSVSITVSSPETSFWTIVLIPDRPRPDTVMESALEAFDEYDDLDVYQSEGEVCDYPCLQCELEFVSLELINTANITAFRTGRFSVLMLSQGTDHELEYTRETLDAITASLSCDIDDDVMKA